MGPIKCVRILVETSLAGLVADVLRREAKVVLGLTGSQALLRELLK